MKFIKLLMFIPVFLAACGGSGPSSVEARLDLGVDWQSFSDDVSIAKYAGMISAKATVASLEPVEVMAEDGVYHFELGSVADGEKTMLLELLYSGSVIAGMETVVEFKDKPLEINISSADVTPSDPSRSLAELILNISPLNENDADFDGLSDAEELAMGLSPLAADTDGDGLADGAELTVGCDPKIKDTDGDLFNDGEDAFPLDASEHKDSDRDGVGDNGDNCKMAPNYDQRDSNGDGVGDACSFDDDGDGLSDVEELKFGCDPLNADSDFDGLSDSFEVASGLNPLKADSDLDGVDDAEDVFPLDAEESSDFDMDGVGDAKDNCRSIPNSDQQNTDAEYFALGIKTPNGDAVAPDDDGDACDVDFDGDGESAVFVSFSSVAEMERGSFYEPYRSVGAAVQKAGNRGDSIKVAYGTYDVRDVDFSKVKKISGGYSGDFSQRVVMSSVSGNKTELINSTSPVVVALTGKDVSIELDGLFIKSGGVQDGVGGVLPDNGIFVCHTAPVFLSEAQAKIKNSVIVGSDTSQASCGIAADNGAKLTIENTVVKGGGAASSLRSAAIVAQNSMFTATDSFLAAGSGRYATAVASELSQMSIFRSVVNGSSGGASPKSSTAVRFFGGSLFLEENKIFTASSLEQTLLACGGAWPLLGSLKNNTLVTFPKIGSNSVLFDCDGNFVTTNVYDNSQSAICRFGFDCLSNVSYSGTVDELFEDVYDIL